MIRKMQLLGVFISIVVLLSACGQIGSATGNSLGRTPPQPDIRVSDTLIKVYQSSYCWSTKCADYAGPELMLKDKEKHPVAPNATIEFEFEGKQPTEVYVSYFHNETPTEVELNGNTFKAPSEKGVYYYALSATWLKDKEKRISEGSSSYVFVIEVTGE